MSKKLTTEDKIIESAIKIFSEKGYSASSTRDIAKGAGVAEGTIFRYFPNKKSLLLKIGKLLMETFGESIVIGPIEKIIKDNTHESVEIVLKKIIINRLEMIEKHSDKILILLSEAKYHTELKDVFEDIIIKKMIKVIYPLLDDLKIKYDLRDLDNFIIARNFMGSAAMLGVQRLYMPSLSTYSIDEDIDNVIDLLINGLRKY